MPLVYMATNQFNGHRYVGRTAKTLDYRRKRHEYCAFSKSGKDTAPRMGAALRKYGREVFSWEILQTYNTVEEAVAGEADAIAKYHPEYNVTAGGEPAPVCMGWNKLSIICLNDGEIFPSMTVAAKEYGVSLSEVSEACSGKTLSVKGLHFMIADAPMTEEERLDIIRIKKETHAANRSWKARPQEWRENEMLRRTNGNYKTANPDNVYVGVADGKDGTGRSAAGPIANSRAVVCLDDGLVYPSASAAARAYDAARSAVIELCLGKNGRRTVNGHRFSYVDVT